MPELLEIAEVVSALVEVIKPTDTIVSRLAIETQVVNNSLKYPHIGSKSQRELRKVITESMDFLYGNQCEGKYRHKWIWNISSRILTKSQEIEYRNVIVPCVCCAGHPVYPDSNCQYCAGTGKIMYGIADVEVQ